MSRFLVCVFLALSFTAPHATETTEHDYAYGMRLDRQQTASFYQLNLPMEVYGSVVFRDLRDVRVLNAAGDELPIWLRSAFSQHRQEEKKLTLPLFPLPRVEGNNRTTPKIHVITSKDGAIVNISDKQDKMSPTKAVYYIIDASKTAGRLRSLQLNWQTIPVGKIVAISLSYSNDLHNWTALDEASLSYLEFNGQKLYQNHISLPNFNGRYLRLNPSEALENRLASVVATVSNQHTSMTPAKNLTLKAELDLQASAYTVDAGARLPVNKLNIDLGQDNAVVDYAVYGRSHKDDAWTDLGTHNFYHYRIQGTQTRNHSVHIKSGMWRYFKLQPQQKGGPKQLPVLELSWIPHQLIFMVQGDGPYQLVYGRGDVGSVEKGLSRLIDKIKPEEQKNAIGLVSTGPQQMLCGDPCLKVPDSPVNYTRYVLWLVVVVGFLLVLWMVVRLSREMKVGV
ncbi:MAG: DUF3999 domain-containing protein [Gammaproteobacteria bacterium]|nr:DUF3999 domain-containing protein [Gammaproteobacteria bacterium]